MYMVEKLDAGDILTQVEVPIDERDTVGTLHDKLSEAGAKLLSETLPKLLRGDITPIKQDDEQATLHTTLNQNKNESIGQKRAKTFITIFAV
ncbi:Methionyl-tRNA formyltransferase [Anoxybacillus sp. BCO1]|nr:Methionyl-tRNA formyltransferase [Anoxybacillus sp. BCO1]